MSVKNIRIEAGKKGEIVNITTWGDCPDHSAGDVASWLKLAGCNLVRSLDDNGSVRHSEPGSLWGVLTEDLKNSTTIVVDAEMVIDGETGCGVWVKA